MHIRGVKKNKKNEAQTVAAALAGLNEYDEAGKKSKINASVKVAGVGKPSFERATN